MGSRTHYSLVSEIGRASQIENDGHIISIISCIERR